MPATGWNGNFEAVGNNGYAGNIVYAAMATPPRRLCTANSEPATRILKWIGVGHGRRAKQRIVISVIAPFTKCPSRPRQLIEAFYGSAPSCLTSMDAPPGPPAMTEAQRYPEDFNGNLRGRTSNELSMQMFSR